MQVIDDDEDCCGNDKPIDVISSDIGANLSHQENLNNTVNDNHFNAFANSFHVTEEVNTMQDTVARQMEKEGTLTMSTRILKHHFPAAFFKLKHLELNL